MKGSEDCISLSQHIIASQKMMNFVYIAVIVSVVVVIVVERGNVCFSSLSDNATACYHHYKEREATPSKAAAISENTMK